MDAFTAAVEAANAVAYSDGFMRGAVHDYETILSLHLGTYPEAGATHRPVARRAARAALTVEDRPQAPRGLLALGPQQRGTADHDQERFPWQGGIQRKVESCLWVPSDEKRHAFFNFSLYSEHAEA